jgi:riboflavin synthase
LREIGCVPPNYQARLSGANADWIVKGMFTGIIEELGAVERLEPRATGSRLTVRAPLVSTGLRAGDRVSVNGVCLTVVDPQPSTFGADVAPETLRRSSLGALRPGSPVNLERALQAGARLGGHIVQGHVDGTGEVVSIESLGGENYWLRVKVPPELDRYFVYKGSVAIDGISLTVAEIEGGIMSVTVIPHTWANTNLRACRAGDVVNLETDVLAKYVEKMLGALDLRKPRLTEAGLREQGY